MYLAQPSFCNFEWCGEGCLFESPYLSKCLKKGTTVPWSSTSFMNVPLHIMGLETPRSYGRVGTRVYNIHVEEREKTILYANEIQ